MSSGCRSVYPGTTEGFIQVTNDGASEYNIPIFSPDGRAGLRPFINLHYNSRRSNGPLGQGWSITGVSEIRRGNMSIASDGRVRGVKFDRLDPLFLDGQRLIKINHKTNSDCDDEYRTEKNPFFRICSYNNELGEPEFFKVWKNDDLIYEYGGWKHSIKTDKKQTLVWILRRVSDRHNNFIDYEYKTADHYNDIKLNTPIGFGGSALVSGALSSIYILDEIRYTGNADYNLIPNKIIKFEYEKRPDFMLGFHNGIQSNVGFRLKRIIVEYKDKVIKVYHFGYTQDPFNGASLVSSIKECGASGNCKQPSEFKYQEFQNKFERIHDLGALDLFLPPLVNGEQTVSRDFDGDGKEEIYFDKGDFREFHQHSDYSIPCTVYGEPLEDWHHCPHKISVVDLSNNGFTERILRLFYDGGTDNFRPGFPFDFNNDGLTDIISHDLIYWRRGSLLKPLRDKIKTNIKLANEAEESKSAFEIWPADYNGDGVKDILVATELSKNFIFYENKANGIDIRERVTNLQVPSGFKFDGTPIKSGFTLDYDGNGTAELFLFDSNNGRLLGIEYRKGQFWSIFIPEFPSRWSSIGDAITGDFNGDGLQDLMVTDWTKVSLWLNTGKGFVDSGVKFNNFVYWNWTTPRSYNLKFSKTVKIIDVDYDNRDDIVYYDAGRRRIRALTLKNSKIKEIVFDFVFDRRSRILRPPIISDFNGDGLLDFLFAEHEEDDGEISNRGWRFYLARGKKPLLLSEIRDGLNPEDSRSNVPATFDIKYKSTSQLDPLTERYLTNSPNFVSRSMSDFMV